MSIISFVYFDLGGVVIRNLTIDENAWSRMKRDLGVPPSFDQEFDAYYDKIELLVQAGADIDSFLPEMAQKFHLTFPIGYSVLTDLTSRFHKNESIWPVIDAAKKIGKIGLLTNTYPRLLDKIKQANLLPAVAWDVIIDSSIEGTQKPEARIYEIATERAGVAPEEIFFIDDRPKNLAAAERVGWQTFLYDPRHAEESSQHLMLQFMHA